MATARGSTIGVIYPLGKFTVANIGTVVALSANVPLTDYVGTPTGGVPGNTSSGSPSPLKCCELKIMTPTTNTGNIFLVFKLTTAAGDSGSGVILVVPPGTERTIKSSTDRNLLTLNRWSLDTDANGSVCWATAVIL